jgi:Flp pilus assembly protein TadB
VNPEEDAEWVDSADRKIAVRALAEHLDEERITAEEHTRRRELVRKARNRGDLRALFADLPPPHPMLGESPVPVVGSPSSGRAMMLTSGAVIVVVAVAAGWWLPALIFAAVLVLAGILTTVGRLDR